MIELVEKTYKVGMVIAAAARRPVVTDASPTTITRANKRSFPVAPRNEYWEACWDTREEKSQRNGSHRGKWKILAILCKAIKAVA